MLTTHNQRGQSLVSVLVAVGVMGIVMMGIASMQTSQNRETRALMEKLSSAELSRVLISNLDRATTCNMMFTKSGNVLNPGNLNFADSPGSFPFSISLKAIPFDATTDTASTASPVSTLSQTLQIQPNGITVKVINATSGQLQIKFDQSKLIRPIPDLNFPITLSTTAAGSTKTIQGCVSEGPVATPPDAPCAVSNSGGIFGGSGGSQVYAPLPGQGGLGTEMIGPCLSAVVTDGKVPFGTSCQSPFTDGSTGTTSNGKVVTCLGGKWVLTGYNPPPPPAPSYPGGF